MIPVAALVLATGALLAACGSSSESSAPPARLPVSGELAARRAEAVWTAFLLTERPRLAVTAVARAPHSYLPYLTYTIALMEGRFWLPHTPPSTPWTFHGYRVISARHALALLRTNPGDAVPAVGALRATSLRLTWATFDTARGKRRLPAWEFHAGGLSEPLFALAVNDPRLLPTALQVARTVDNPENEMSGRLSTDGQEITLRFVGAPAGHRPCDASYSADALYDDLSLVVSFWIIQHTVGAPLDATTNHTRSASLPVACRAVGDWRTVRLRLPGPLGHRPLIDSRDDAPVRVIGAAPH